MPESAEAVAELTLLVEVQAQLRQRATDIATTAAEAAVLGFTEWYSSSAIAEWAASLLGQVEAAQRQLAALTDTYLARVSSLIQGRPVAPIGPVDVRNLRRVDDMTAVYGRAADQFRYAVSQGADTRAATETALQRAVSIARDDADLAVREQSTQVMRRQPTLTGYRRVIHPELPTEASLRDGRPPPPVCGLCIAASTRMYGRSEPMPIHANCRCLPMPVYGTDDFGGAINKAALKVLYRHAGDTSATKLSHTRYEVVEHGELGPVLRLKGHKFQGPTDIPFRP